ncbi:MAG: hypothetical protein OQK51_14665 [Kangiellaceae bacterium]|nr:hypothetical protein [Kangiellaceae bacterium]
MDEIYGTPESEVLQSEGGIAKRWDFKKAWDLVSKKFILSLVLLNFVQLWLKSYFDMINYIEKQGDDPAGIGRSNIFFYMLDLGLVMGSVLSVFVLGLIPFLVISYKQSNKVSVTAQAVWGVLVLSFVALLWLKPV